MLQLFLGAAAAQINSRCRSENSTSVSDPKTLGGKKTPNVNRNFPPPVPEYSKKSMFVKHIWALTIKRFHHTKRNKKGFIFEVYLIEIVYTYFSHFIIFDVFESTH